MVAKAKFRIEGEDATFAAFRSALGNAKTTADGMQKAFKYAFAGISAYTVVSGIKNAIGGAIEMGDELNKAAIKAGIGGRAISELAHAAKMSDIELDALSTSLKKMQVNLSEAATGGKQQQESLRALGIALADIKGLAADKQFEMIADRISKLTDPADRARAATELFGKAGADLLPMFEQGAEGIRKAREEAQALGKSFSDEQIKALSDADTAVKQLKASWEGFAVSLTSKVAGPLSDVLDLLHGQKPTRYGDAYGSPQEQLTFWKGLRDGPPDDSAGSKRLEERIAVLQSVVDGTMDDYAARRSRAMQAPAAPGYKASADAEAAAAAAAKARKQAAEDYSDVLQQAARDSDGLARSLEDLATPSQDLVDLTYDQIQAEQAHQQFNDEMRDTMVANLQEIYSESEKTFDGMSVYADQAARNMQDAFADFLFDPFDDGLDGMLKGFVDILRRMAAEAAAARIFDSRDAGGFGLGDIIRSGLGGAGRGGGDSIPTGPSTAELFAAAPSSSIQISAPVSIDMRGASVDAVQEMRKQLPAILDSRDARLIEGIRRGKYSIGAT